MQGAKTLKTIFPCSRRVHLHKSAGLKTIFEQIPNKHKNDAKNDPDETTVKLHKNIMRKKMKIQQILRMFRCWLPLWTHLLEPFPRWRVFVRDLFFGTSEGYPLGQIWASLGAHLVRFCRLVGRFL